MFYLITFVCLVFMSMLCVLDIRNKDKDFKPIIISLGVLGTFVGIFIGLWNFNSEDISSSVPDLLVGLKTAFITSIMGMLLAVLLSIFEKKSGEAEDELSALRNIEKKLEKLDSVDQKLSDLTEIKKEVQTLPKINTKLDTINKNIKGLSKDISNVNDDLKKNQETLSNFLEEKLDNIDNNLKEAVKTLSKGATEEIIKALEKVIQDFNENLTDQFGNNFTQLNKAVKELVIWQENYKQIIEQSQESHENSKKTHQEFITQSQENYQKISDQSQQYFDKIEGKLNNFVDQAGKFADISTDLENLLIKLNDENEKMKSWMSGFAELAEKAKEGFPVIKENIDTMTEKLKDNFDNLDKNLTDFTQKFKITIEKVAKDMTDENSKYITDLFDESVKVMDDKVELLNQELEKSLNASMETLGTNLNTISGAFVQTYKKLQEQIREISQIISNINDKK